VRDGWTNSDAWFCSHLHPDYAVEQDGWAVWKMTGQMMARVLCFECSAECEALEAALDLIDQQDRGA
jgi:hypothetical protein